MRCVAAVRFSQISVFWSTLFTCFCTLRDFEVPSMPNVYTLLLLVVTLMSGLNSLSFPESSSRQRVGFGKFASLSYEQLRDTQLGYVKWVLSKNFLRGLDGPSIEGVVAWHFEAYFF